MHQGSAWVKVKLGGAAPPLLYHAPTMRFTSTLSVVVLLASVATLIGCKSGSDDGGTDLGVPSAAPLEFVAIQLLFARQNPPGVSVGFDIDNYTAADGDPKTCGHASLASPTGDKGIDNQMSVFVTALDTQYDHAVDDIIQGGINNGMLLIGARFSGVDDVMNDSAVLMELVQLHGSPIVGTDKLLAANQTFSVAEDTPLAAVNGSVSSGVFQSERFDMRLPVALLTANFSIRLHGALLRVPLAPSMMSADIAPALLGGTVEIQNMLDGLLPLELDDGFKARMPALFDSLADQGKDAQTGKCVNFSAAIKLPMRSAFFSGATDGADMGAPIGCGGLLLCLNDCKAAASCEQACFARTTPGGRVRFDELAACTQHVCEPPPGADGGVPDGGTYACRFHDDTSDACRTCLAGAAQSPNCRQQFSDCFADF